MTAGSFAVDLEDLAFVGSGLDRPECVLTTARGVVYCSDRRRGVACIDAAGGVGFLLPGGPDAPPDLMTNGFAMTPEGHFLLANLGPSGGVHELVPGEGVRPFLLEVEGRRLPPTNFVNRDEQGRVWISVSTWHEPRDDAMRHGVADGFVVLVDARGSRVVADGIGYTNENKIHPDGRHLYVNETFTRRVSRYALRDDGSLGPRETVAELDDGIFPDGLDFDAEGGIWIASVVSNRLLRIGPDGSRQVVVDDSDPEAVARAEANYAADRFSREDIDAGRDGVLGNLASVTFGGPDLRTAYLGSLFSDRIATFRSPVAGAPPPHWNF